MLLFLYWNPKQYFFLIPHLNIPLGWYNILFVFGLIVSYYIFFSFLYRYFLNFYLFDEKDIKDTNLLIFKLKNPETEQQKDIVKAISSEEVKKLKNKRDIVSCINNLFSNFDLNKKKKIKGIKDSSKALLRLFLEKNLNDCFYTIKHKTIYLTDKMTIYVVIATMIGSRIGHIILYDDLMYYLKDPIRIFKVWEGGLASHGAVVFIIIAIFILSYRLKNIYPRFTFLKLLDLVSLSALFVSSCIRLGNFFNQEILGKETTLSWGVIFGSTMDGSSAAIRHPVQLYESIFYLFLFFIFLFLSYSYKIYLKKGKLIGLVLFLVFTFRFCIEFLKEKQSILISNESILSMGQYLSIPFIILGIIFLCIRSKKI